MKPFENETWLLVDDDEVFRRQLARALERRGISSVTAGSYDEALAKVSESSFEKAVIDLRLEGPNGLEILEMLLERSPELEVVMLTGYGSIATALDAVRLGAVNYIQKPAMADDVIAAFQRASGPKPSAAEIAYEAPSLARLEWEHIHRVMADSGGNISEAARRLGIHRRTLQRKLNTYAPDTK